jgi:hypothetical protein
MKPAFKDPAPNLVRLRDPQGADFPSRGLRDHGGHEAGPDTLSPERQPSVEALVRENKFILRLLDDRDRQFASVQCELSAMRRDWVWRTLGVLKNEVRRARRQFWRRGLMAEVPAQSVSRLRGPGSAD